MKSDKNNLNIKLSRLKRKIYSHVELTRIVILAFLLIIVGLGIFFSLRAISSSPVGVYIGLVRDFVFPSPDRVNSTGGRVNVLIMGKAGAGNDAPDLTDSMMLASVSFSSSKISLISIPRDIWMDDLKAKINASYYWGKTEKGNGLALSESEVEEVVGTPINYAMVIDLNAFKDVVEALGGIQVSVQTSFTDNQYPVVGHEADPCFSCRYQTISFKAGTQIMDGNTAQIFVRSRHGDNGEGDDLHREARQQLVIQAILKKVLTPKILTSPEKISSLMQIANKNVETDIKLSEAATLARYVIDAKSNLKTYGIPQDLLIMPTPTAQYLFTLVFIPKKGLTNWTDVQKWVQTILP
jgi:LCP family protein required for cell wall assembly